MPISMDIGSAETVLEGYVIASCQACFAVSDGGLRSLVLCATLEPGEQEWPIVVLT